MFVTSYLLSLQIRIVGKVIGVAKIDTSQYVEYTVQEMGDQLKASIVVLEFKGVSLLLSHLYNIAFQEEVKSRFVEESVVQVVGKLRSNGGELSIMALHMRKIEDKGEVETHRLESKMAELYYKKVGIRYISLLSTPFAERAPNGPLIGGICLDSQAHSSGAKETICKGDLRESPLSLLFLLRPTRD
jgi:hypothetical protein